MGRPTSYVALLRAVNLAGTNKLSMKELSALCTKLGFTNCRTYIASGNLLFESTLGEKAAQSRLEEAVAKHMGKKVDIILRTAAELQSVLDANPFPALEPAKVAVLFLHDPVRPALLETVVAPAGEQVRLGERELYVHYPIGLGNSKLKIPALKVPATARNINTVTKLAALAKKQV